MLPLITLLKRSLQAIKLTPIPGARPDELIPLQVRASLRESTNESYTRINERDRESTNENESRFIERDRARESTNENETRFVERDRARETTNEIARATTRDTPLGTEPTI